MTARTLALVGRHFCEGCHSTVADGFGIYFAIYPKDNFSCLASFEQKYFAPVSTVLWTTDFNNIRELVASQDKFIPDYNSVYL